MHALIILSGKNKGRRIELPEREILIGREESCLVRMTSPEVSRQHCSLTPTERGLVVRDRNSQNGTFVNHVRIEAETLLKSGDRLQVGPVHFQIEGPPSDEDSLEESVLSWLADSEVPSHRVTGDTTVVRVPQQLHAPQLPATPAAAAPMAGTPWPRVFRNVAEEAQDIIREWRELQTGKPQLK